MQLVDQQPTTTFTTQELARLAVYRAAVGAGFYSDWDGSADSTDRRLAARLLRDQPFTAEERQHLRKLRRQIAAGDFADDAPRRGLVVTETDTDGRPLAE